MLDRTLIVLFGHENDSIGRLSQIAIARCDTAITVLEQHPSAYVLPTGAFGRNFNRTDKRHSHYLADYLVQKGMNPSIILPGTLSSNTYEDCLCARKLIIDRGFDNVIAVTSDYHVPRVSFILEYLFNGIEFTVISAPTTPELLSSEQKNEVKRFRALRKEWLAPLLYQKQEFPKSVYEASANEHRHYDTVSLAVVSSILVVAAFAFVANVTGPLNMNKLKAAIFVAAAVIDTLLLFIYLRSAHMASIGRRMLRYIEIAFDFRGFSANHDPARHWTPPIRIVIPILSLSIILGLLLAGSIAFCGGVADKYWIIRIFVELLLLWLFLTLPVVLLGWILTHG